MDGEMNIRMIDIVKNKVGHMKWRITVVIIAILLFSIGIYNMSGTIIDSDGSIHKAVWSSDGQRMYIDDGGDSFQQKYRIMELKHLIEGKLKENGFSNCTVDIPLEESKTTVMVTSTNIQASSSDYQRIGETVIKHIEEPHYLVQVYDNRLNVVFEANI